MRSKIDLEQFHDLLVKRYVDERVPPRVITQELNELDLEVSAQTVIRYLDSIGVFRHRTKLDPELKDSIINMYVVDRMSPDEIANVIAKPGDKRRLKGKIIVLLRKANVYRNKREALNDPIIKKKVIDGKLHAAARRVPKLCSHCGQLFRPYDSQQRFCIVCVPTDVDYARVKFYGVNRKQYENLMLSQNYSCAICNRLFSDITPMKNRISSEVIDHCHKTGTVRGVLCRRCNMWLGFLEANVHLLDQSLEYLKKNTTLTSPVEDLLDKEVRLLPVVRKYEQNHS